MKRIRGSLPAATVPFGVCRTSPVARARAHIRNVGVSPYTSV